MQNHVKHISFTSGAKGEDGVNGKRIWLAGRWRNAEFSQTYFVGTESGTRISQDIHER